MLLSILARSSLLPVLALSLLYSLAAPFPAGAATVHEIQLKMGSRFEVTAVAAEEEAARAAVAAAWAEIDRIEALISSWRPDSETSRVNEQAGKGPVKVSPELVELVARSLKVSELTGGAFDISFAAAGRLWDFKADPPRIPEPEAVAAALANVDYRRIRVNRQASTIELLSPGMRIGFGAMGKGYAANRALALMRERGMTGAVVNAGGDLAAFGTREDGLPWTVGITDPKRPTQVFAYVQVSGQAVVTSGDYENFLEIAGVRYAHILDPRTGMPVRGVASVTVICPDAELADALATGVFVLGREEGLALLDRLRGIEGLIVDDAGDLHFSSGLESKFLPRVSQQEEVPPTDREKEEN